MGQINSTTTLRKIFSSVNRARIGLGGSEVNGIVAGTDSYQLGRAGISPFQFLPDSEATRRECFMYHWYSGAQLIATAGTTDGTTSDHFFVNTNSATATATSASAGYEGQALLTTGGTTGNHAGWIGNPSFLPVANQIGVCYCSVLLPDPATATQFDFYFGFMNKTIAPGTSTTFPTDGAYWKGVGANSLPMKGITSSNAANTDNDAQATRTASATKFTIAAATTVSMQLAIVMNGQASVDFWWRLPASASNTWNTFNQATTIPRATIQMRPHFIPVTRYSGTSAFAIQDMAYWWFRPLTW